MTRVGQFSASVVNTSTKVLDRDDLRTSIHIQNHSASKDLILKLGSAFKAAVVQVQTISFNGTPTEGAWKLSFGGNETGSLAYNINAADLQTALRLVSGLSSVTVAGSVAAGFTVTMTSVAHVVGNPAALTVSANTLSRAAVYTVAFSEVPTAGAWKLKIGAFTTAELAFDDDNAAVQTAVRALTGLSSATVTGNYTDGFTVTLLGVAFATTFEVVQSTLEVIEEFEVQTIAFDNIPDAGTWTIAYGEEETASLAFDANAAAIQAALRLIEGLEAVTVSGDYATEFSVAFVDVEGDVDDLTIDTSALEFESGAVTAIVAEDSAYIAQEDVDTTVANTVALLAVTPSVAITTPGNLVDAGFVMAEGTSILLTGPSCQGELYAKSEDSTAVSFEVIPL